MCLARVEVKTEGYRQNYLKADFHPVLTSALEEQALSRNEERTERAYFQEQKKALARYVLKC